MNQKAEGVCSGGPTLIFPCSGGADLGEISDRAARKMTREGTGRMFCLAGIAARVDPIMVTTESANRLLAIDGCAMDCAKHTLEKAGFSDVAHVRLTDLGMEKGQTPLTDDAVARVADCAAKTLG